jgi:hypothetical protein
VDDEDRRGFDGGEGDVGQWRDVTAAHEGRPGETGRGEKDDSWVGVSVEVGRGVRAVYFVGGYP